MMKTKKSGLRLIMAIVMLLALSCSAWALTLNADGVYEIGTAAELAEFRDMVNAGSNDIDGKLTANITLPDEAWMPIGTWVFESGASLDHTYQGIFDGNGKTIVGLKVRPERIALSESGPTGTHLGAFFGMISNLGVVQNLTLTNVDVDLSDTQRSSVGALIAVSDSGIVQNCSVIGGRVAGSQTYTVGVGGLVGYLQYDSQVLNCSVAEMTELKGDMNGSVGGLVGVVDHQSKLQNSYAANIGMISGNILGGIAAYVRTNSIEIINCYALDIDQFLGKQAGTLVGYIVSGGKLTNCAYVSTKPAASPGDIISADINKEGGIVGVLAGSVAALGDIKNCLYPSNLIFSQAPENRAIGNIANTLISTAGRDDLLPYNVASADPELPAIVAALAQGHTVSLVVGETYDLDVSTFPGTSGDFVCSWLSANSDIVGVTSGSGGLTATLTAVEVGTTEVTVKIRGTLTVDLTCIVNVTDTVEPATSGEPADDGSIYPDEEVDLTYDFSPYIAVGVDNSGMQTDISGLLAEILGGKVVVTGIAKEPGTYYYVVTLENANGVRFTQRVDVVIQGGSRPAGGSGGSSNCNSGVGAALFALLGLAFVYKKK